MHPSDTAYLHLRTSCTFHTRAHFVRRSAWASIPAPAHLSTCTLVTFWSSLYPAEHITDRLTAIRKSAKEKSKQRLFIIRHALWLLHRDKWRRFPRRNTVIPLQKERAQRDDIIRWGVVHRVFFKKNFLSWTFQQKAWSHTAVPLSHTRWPVVLHGRTALFIPNKPAPAATRSLCARGLNPLQFFIFSADDRPQLELKQLMSHVWSVFDVGTYS